MNKRYLLFFSFLLILLFSFPYYKAFIINLLNVSKENLEYFLSYIGNEISLYRQQAKQISELKKENFLLKQKINNLESFYQNCKDLKLIKDSNLFLTKVISYANLPNFSEIYVKFVSDKYPLGLVYNNLAVGILVKRVGNYSLGFLNSNKKTSYSVLIGKSEIPGIFYGKLNVIKFIPKFKKINVGDIVITSGLDGIFYKGAKVGIITHIKSKKLYQEAKIKLFYNNLAPNYLYVVKKNDRIIKKGGDNG